MKKVAIQLEKCVNIDIGPKSAHCQNLMVHETEMIKIARRTTGAKDFYLVQGIDSP